jgi:hypothetical protein
MKLPDPPEGRRRAATVAPVSPPPPPRRGFSIVPPPEPEEEPPPLLPRPRPAAAPPRPPEREEEAPAAPPVEPPEPDRPAPTARPASAPIPPEPAAPRPWLSWLRRQSPAETAAERLRHADDPAPEAPRPALAASPLAGLALPPLLGPVRAQLEGFGLLALLALLDLLLGARGFGHWPVHPFALPVLYVAARYGLWPGLAVALAAAILRLGLALAADLWTPQAWAEPLAWPVAAVLVGGIAELQRRRLAAAERTAEAATSDRAAISESNDRLAARAAELEARLGARLSAATAVFEATRVMGEGTEGVIRGACGLVRAATGCTACSFWLAEGGALHLVAQEGWPPGARLAQSFARGPLVEAIAEGRGALLVSRPGDRLALGEEGILAAPVLSPWDRHVLGMVKVEDIGFAELAPDTVAALESAAAWIGTALAEARAREAQRVASGGLAGLSVVAGEDAGRAIAAMTGLARRVGFDLALLSAEIPAGPRSAAALEAVRAAMAEVFRDSDLLLELRLEERRLSVLLPGAAVGGAEAAAARLRAVLAERAAGTAAGVVVGIAWLHAARR